MARKILIAFNFNQNEIQNAVLQNLGSAPSTPVEGQMYWDTAAHRPYIWNNNSSAWEMMATNSDKLNTQSASYYLSRANHTGSQTAATISDLATVVQAYRLDQFAAPNVALSMNGQKITNGATPTASTDFVIKSYVDSVIQGLTPKPTATVATAAALAANTYSNGTSGVGATLTANANGALTVDGYAVLLNDVVLVKNEVTASHNGLYTQTQLGDGSHPYILTRHVDMDTTAEFGGSFIPVESNGTVTANTLWLCNVNAPTVGTTAISFVQLNSATSYTQGNGISISGNTVSAVVAASGGLAVSGSGLALDTTIAVAKYATNVGDGVSTAIAITHNLGTRDVVVSVYLATTPYGEVDCDIQHTSTTQVTLTFASAPTSNQYRVVVHA